jgi:hypothetical protein
VRRSTLTFNKEILLGECGALVLANLTAPVLSRFTRNPTVISSAAVAATLAGGGLCWLAARIYDRTREEKFHAATLARDITYFTPAALVLGFCVYDPAIYLVSHHLMVRGAEAWRSVVAGQLVAFLLFLGSLNLYRAALLRLRGPAL